MSTHGDISMELSAYLDGQLPPEAGRFVERAATESAEIARKLHDLRRIRTLLRSLTPVGPGEGFVERVLAEARRRGLMRRVGRQRKLGYAVRLASAAAAVMLVAAVAGVAVNDWMRPPETKQIAAREPGRPSEPGPAPANHAIRGKPVGPGAPLAAGRNSAKIVTLGALDAKNNDLNNYYFDLSPGPQTLDLTVTDLGAGAKEVTAVLAMAGVNDFADETNVRGMRARFAKSDGGSSRSSMKTGVALKPASPAETPRAKSAAAKPAASASQTVTAGESPSPKLQRKASPPAPIMADAPKHAPNSAGQVAVAAGSSAPGGTPKTELFVAAKQAGNEEKFGTNSQVASAQTDSGWQRESQSPPPVGYVRIAGEGDEVRFIVVAPPDEINAVMARLASLRTSQRTEQSANGLCIEGITNQASKLPKLSETRPSGANTAIQTESQPYHAAELPRLLTAQQRQEITQRSLGTTSQSGGLATRHSRPRLQTLIITVHRRPPTNNQADPGRNTLP